MQSLKSRIANKNPRVQLAALGLTDVCIKNGGDHFLQQVASREFIDELVGVVKSAGNPQVGEAAKRYFQSWALAFEKKSELGLLPETYRQLKNEGESFLTHLTLSSLLTRLPRSNLSPTTIQHPLPPPHHRHPAHLARLGHVHALPYPILIYKP